MRYVLIYGSVDPFSYEQGYQRLRTYESSTSNLQEQFESWTKEYRELLGTQLSCLDMMMFDRDDEGNITFIHNETLRVPLKVREELNPPKKAQHAY